MIIRIENPALSVAIPCEKGTYVCELILFAIRPGFAKDRCQRPERIADRSNLNSCNYGEFLL